MENIVSWVYISEDISTSTFLNGGELIITTGVTSGECEDWLRAFIKELIHSFIAEQLGGVIEYDKTHHSALTDTLYEYLKCSGSVQHISEKMFCHRNTINYRLRIIKEELEYDLSDAEVRFQVMAAYKLREIRKV